MIGIKKTEWLLLVGLLVLSFVPVVGGTFRLAELGLGTSIEFLPINPRIESAPIPVIFHLVSSIVYCILGAFQFLPTLRKNHPLWHRVAGRLLVCAGVVSALSGLWMTHFYAFPAQLQGTLLYVVRVIVSVAMVIFIGVAVSSILKKRVIKHQAFMIRAYALGQGAGTQVLITLPWLLSVGEPEGFTREILMSAAWVVNIAVGEWVIKKLSN
mgnify:FL=1